MFKRFTLESLKIIYFSPRAISNIMTPKEAIERLLNAQKIDNNWFTDISIGQIPGFLVLRNYAI